MDLLAPVILFVYNRPQHTEKTLDALKKNFLANESELYIFSDAPKTPADKGEVNSVRELIKQVEGFKKITIIENQKNKGLAGSIIDGVTDVIEKHKRVIILEDDLITSTLFLRYMNAALNYYQDFEQVYSIGAFNYPERLMKLPEKYTHNVYFMPRPCSWGWATWHRQWQKADWGFEDRKIFLKSKNLQAQFNMTGENSSLMMKLYLKGKVDSWAIRWHYTHFKDNKYCVYPVKSLVNNIGLDKTGTNTGNESLKYYHETLLEEFDPETFFTDNIKLDEEILKGFQQANKIDPKLKYWLFLKQFIFYDQIKSFLKG